MQVRTFAQTKTVLGSPSDARGPCASANLSRARFEADRPAQTEGSRVVGRFEGVPEVRVGAKWEQGAPVWNGRAEILER